MTNAEGLHREPVFAVGTGRCGTHLLAELFACEPGVHACHESDPFHESFHRYCQWNGLPVDDLGFLDSKRKEIESAGLSGRVFFEASAYLSLSVEKLFRAFRSRFILITRNPVDTVNSLWVKGWYETNYRKQDGASAIGYHAVGQPHHFFSRLVPVGEEFRRWESLGRIGKLGWFWSALHRGVLDQFGRLPEANRRVVKLEELDHDGYLGLARFAGVESRVSKERFGEIAAARPGSLWTRRGIEEWNQDDLREFRREVTEVARRLGYSVDFAAQWNRAWRKAGAESA